MELGKLFKTKLKDCLNILPVNPLALAMGSMSIKDCPRVKNGTAHRDI